VPAGLGVICAHGARHSRATAQIMPKAMSG